MTITGVITSGTTTGRYRIYTHLPTRCRTSPFYMVELPDDFVSRSQIISEYPHGSTRRHHRSWENDKDLYVMFSTRHYQDKLRFTPREDNFARPNDRVPGACCNVGCAVFGEALCKGGHER